jgi:hypothetical protein
MFAFPLSQGRHNNQSSKLFSSTLELPVACKHHNKQQHHIPLQKAEPTIQTAFLERNWLCN